MSAVDVLAFFDAVIESEKSVRRPSLDAISYATAARAAVAEQHNILRRLVAWNRNPNGDGNELDALLGSAEALVGYDIDADHPRHDFRDIPAVAELIEAATNAANILPEGSRYGIELRAALASVGGAK